MVISIISADKSTNTAVARLRAVVLCDPMGKNLPLRLFRRISSISSMRAIGTRLCRQEMGEVNFPGYPGFA